MIDKDEDQGQATKKVKPEIARLWRHRRAFEPWRHGLCPTAPLPHSAGLFGETLEAMKGGTSHPQFRLWPALCRPSTPWSGQNKDDRGREGLGLPLPPNRASGSPAHGSPVAGFLIGDVSRDTGLWK